MSDGVVKALLREGELESRGRFTLPLQVASERAWSRRKLAWALLLRLTRRIPVAPLLRRGE